MPINYDAYEDSAQSEYIGPVGHEKKMYQTHFQIKDKKELKGESKGEWVRIAPGKFKLVWS